MSKENARGMQDEAISRQAAIDATKKHYRAHDNDLLELIAFDIEQLPPIQPKRGRWIKLDMHRGMADHKCTACEQECYVPTCMGEPMYAYCPNCGADMREVINSQPTIQPEIVRCKDCKHWIPYDWMFSEVWRSKNMADYPEDEIGCNWSDMTMKANDFCSRAERRTG